MWGHEKIVAKLGMNECAGTPGDAKRGNAKQEKWREEDSSGKTERLRLKDEARRWTE